MMVFWVQPTTSKRLMSGRPAIRPANSSILSGVELADSSLSTSCANSGFAAASAAIAIVVLINFRITPLPDVTAGSMAGLWPPLKTGRFKLRIDLCNKSVQAFLALAFGASDKDILRVRSP